MAGVGDLLNGYLVVNKAIQSGGGPVLGFDQSAMAEHNESLVEEDHSDLEATLGRLTLASPFAVGGTAKIKSNDVLCWLSMRRQQNGAFEDVGPIKALNPSVVAPYCSTAPFGDLVAQETRVDPNVRCALECKAESLRFNFDYASAPPPAESCALPGLTRAIPQLQYVASKAQVLVNGVKIKKIDVGGGDVHKYTSTVLSSDGRTKYTVNGEWNSRTKRASARCSCPMVANCKHCDATLVKLARQKTKAPQNNRLHCVDAICKAVSEHLLGGSAKITLVLHKLNMYQTGGHFQRHVDTPTHDASLYLGTVIVCLPAAHEGGDLIVRHHGKQHTFKFDALSRDSNQVQWAAFFGDCEHEVKQVTSGTRIVLSYSILRHPSMTDPQGHLGGLVSAQLTKSDAHQGQVAELLDKAHEYMCESIGDSCVGIFMSHMYTGTGLRPDGLKGADRLLYDHLNSKGIPVSLVAVLAKEEFLVYKDYDDGGGDDEPDFSVCLLGNLVGLDSREPVHKLHSGDIPFLTPWECEQVQLKNNHTELQHAGNWVEPGSTERLYLKSAMIMGPFPEVDEQVAAPSKKQRLQ